MFVGEIQVPTSRIRGVGPATQTQLKALGLNTVGDVLTYWPRDWDDRSVKIPISRFSEVHKINTTATVISHEWFGFGRMKTLKIIIKDDEETQAELVCFNRPFLEKAFPVGSIVAVNGSFQVKYGNLQSASFEIDSIDEASTRVLPIYPLTAGITQTQLRKIISHALEEYGRGIESELPETVRLERVLPAKLEILRSMHEPINLAQAERAKKALIFEELFLFEYAIGQRSIERRGKLPEITPCAATESPDRIEAQTTPLQGRLIDRLTFSLTAGQLSALSEINRDLSMDSPMARLLQGDVGSGKTLVAFLACLKVIENSGQCAILAPTELLARQHAETAARLLEPLGVAIAFLTGNLKASGRNRLLEELSSGNIKLVIGTHALFSNGVEYKNLRLVIIDEQHRFGVRQRGSIIEKGTKSNLERKPPHMLMMSATPIPRTLALSVFGDLDVSIIRTMPPGRKPVVTYLSCHGHEERVYEYIGRELRAGHQAYFVYPLIDPSDESSLKSAEEMHETLKAKVFPGISIALIHSRIPEDEQREIMSGFRSGKIQVLVATSVVEVGVDVANATCMVIEHAERFGLSALHQLRGRVGRGNLQSYCFLVYAQNLTEDGKARLRVMHETTDGFVIAEEDLKIRGPGDVTGIQQSGYVAFNLADPIRDQEILLEARAAAFKLLEEAH